MSGNRMKDWLAAARDDVAAHRPDEIVEIQLLARVRERRALQSIETTRPAPARRPVRWWVRLSFGVPAACAAISRGSWRPAVGSGTNAGACA